MMLAASFHSETGNTLFSKCEGQDGVMRGACIGYIEGISDEIQVMQRVGYMKRVYCPTADVNAGQLRDIVVKFLRDNPATRNQPAADLATTALIEAFACMPE